MNAITGTEQQHLPIKLVQEGVLIQLGGAAGVVVVEAADHARVLDVVLCVHRDGAEARTTADFAAREDCRKSPKLRNKHQQSALLTVRPTVRRR